MTPRNWLREHWWLIVWGLIVLVVLAVAELLPPGQAGRVWVEWIHGIP